MEAVLHGVRCTDRDLLSSSRPYFHWDFFFSHWRLGFWGGAAMGSPPQTPALRARAPPTQMHTMGIPLSGPFAKSSSENKACSSSDSVKNLGDAKASYEAAAPHANPFSSPSTMLAHEQMLQRIFPQLSQTSDMQALRLHASVRLSCKP